MMKKWLALLLAGIMTLSLAACGGTPSNEPSNSNPSAPADNNENNEPNADSEKKTYKIGYLTPDTSSGFYQEVLASLQAACTEAGHELVYDIVSDATEMRSAYDTLLLQNVDFILEGYSTREVAIPYVEEAVSSGIPIMTMCFDSGVEGAYAYGTSDQGMGIQFGETAKDIIENKWAGQIPDLIVLISAFSLIPSMDIRVTQTVDTLTEAYPEVANVEVVKVDYQGSYDTVYQQAVDTFTAHPDAQRVLMVGAADSLCSYVISAIEVSEMEDKCYLISSDYSENFQNYVQETLAAGQDRPWYGSLDLETSTYGYKVLDKIEQILAGTCSEVYTEHVPVMVTSDNYTELRGG
ncbi:MAG: substrate-binding domain-containing protein [Oscillospiraceae bacterium]|nr:substrate-binding domain-containing protein [Oscillospiraceae bacterium]